MVAMCIDYALYIGIQFWITSDLIYHRERSSHKFVHSQF